VFERLLRGWREQGYRFATLGECAAYLQPARLPRCTVGLGTIPGRSGQLVLQQAEFRSKARQPA
jgi:undecaprenyl phosphate-alpha-L-ara4FN deformylase